MVSRTVNAMKPFLFPGGGTHRVAMVEVAGHPVFVFFLGDVGEFTSTFARISEFNELEQFGGRVFTLEELQAFWFAENGRHYGDEVAGTNFSPEYLTGFLNSYTGQLSDAERALMEWLGDAGVWNVGPVRPFYVVTVNLSLDPGSYEIVRGVLQHELSHALFYLDEGYNRLGREVWESMDEADRDRYVLFLRQLYTPDRYIDEMVAHIIFAGDDISVAVVSTDDSLRLHEYFEENVPKQLVEELVEFCVVAGGGAVGDCP